MADEITEDGIVAGTMMDGVEKEYLFSFWLEKMPGREPRGLRNLVLEYDRVLGIADVVHLEQRANDIFSKEFSEEIESHLVFWKKMDEMTSI